MTKKEAEKSRRDLGSEATEGKTIFSPEIFRIANKLGKKFPLTRKVNFFFAKKVLRPIHYSASSAKMILG